MWKDFIISLDKNSQLYPPQPLSTIQAVADELAIVFPASLIALLSETDGMLDFSHNPLIWTIADIKKHNLDYRHQSVFIETYMSLASLLFFGGNGAGDVFGFPIVQGVALDKVFIWEPIEDNRLWYASSLKDFFHKWYSPRD